MGLFRRLVFGGAVVAALAAPVLAPSPAQAWWSRPGWGGYGGWNHGWRGGWGWHGGWGWRGGVFIGGPAVVVGPPVGYAPLRWIPGHYTRYGAWVPPHRGYY